MTNTDPDICKGNGTCFHGLPLDNWKHRSDGMRCKTCMWYNPKTVQIPRVRLDGSLEMEDGWRDIGRCRRHAPTMNGFPVVYETDWCGDHKIDEEKI